jgi:hypothetical protein
MVQGPAETPDDLANTAVSGKVAWGEFVSERPSSQTQNISIAIECWSVEHRAFAVETI